MTSLSKEVGAFLKAAGWPLDSVVPLAADFSTRRFYRVQRSSGGPHRGILMQAGPDQKTVQFVQIDQLLRQCDLSAPEIYTAEPDNGLVLMEDFGDTTFGKLLDKGAEAGVLYRRAADVLVRLHTGYGYDPPPQPSPQGGREFECSPDLPVFSKDTFVEQVGLFLDFYVPYARGRKVTEEERQRFEIAWRKTLGVIGNAPQGFMLRDYMPDNLMDLPERGGWKSAGLLDFQDGGWGPIAYDLASLCECVRRDVSLDYLDEVTNYYCRENLDVRLGDLQRACRVLSAQRHMRVMGIVVRLAEKGRPEKLSCLPRMTEYLKNLFNYKELDPVRVWVEGVL